ncbi:TrmH family RNA methyltransferase [Thermoclostridium stercorarium]|nr:RNA methyltransferase [Thermoclostridium stercorarium]
MQFITSRQNKAVKEVILLKDKKYRRKLRKFVTEGYRFLHEAVNSGAVIEHVFFSSDTAMEDRNELVERLGPEVRLYEIPHELFMQMAETDTPQGVLAVVRMPETELKTIFKEGFRGLVLDSIQDPGNAGTMIRTAHALGFDAVVATEGTVDLYNGKVLRSTMGSIFYIPVLENVKPEDIFALSREKSIRVISSRLENARPCQGVDLTGNFFIVVGNEGNGISEIFHEKSDEFVKIPMPGGAESLNAAVAASILMYESNRQQAAGL